MEKVAPPKKKKKLNMEPPQFFFFLSLFHFHLVSFLEVSKKAWNLKVTG